MEGHIAGITHMAGTTLVEYDHLLEQENQKDDMMKVKNKHKISIVWKQ